MIRNIFPLPKISFSDKNYIYNIKDSEFSLSTTELSEMNLYKSVEQEIIDNKIFHIERLLYGLDNELIPYKVKLSERSDHIPKQTVSYCIISNIIRIYRHIFPGFSFSDLEIVKSSGENYLDYVYPVIGTISEIDFVDSITKNIIKTGYMDFSNYLTLDVENIDKSLFINDYNELSLCDYSDYNPDSLLDIYDIVEKTSITDFSINYWYYPLGGGKENDYKVSYANRHISPQIHKIEVKDITLVNKINNYIKREHFILDKVHVKIYKSMDEKIYITISLDYDLARYLIIDTSILSLFPKGMLQI